jgi:hypothetical protein
VKCSMHRQQPAAEHAVLAAAQHETFMYSPK